MNDFSRCNTEKWGFRVIRLLGSVKTKQISTSILGILLVIFVSACANVDPRPFTTFNSVANQIIAIDTALDSHVLSVKQREMGEISNNLKKINGLALEFREENPFKSDYKFSEADEPIFIKLQRLDSGLTELNASFIKYTSLLAALADGDLIKKEEFDQLATDLNGNLRSALISLNNSPDASDLALFSTIASTAAYAYISNKRKEKLIEILEGNQNTVDTLIQYAQAAIQIMRDEIVDEYENTRRALAEGYPNSSDKRLVAYKFLANSERTVAVLEMLKALNDTYAELAVSHKKLGTSLKNDQLPSFSDLIGIITSLQKRYQDLKKINEDADKAEESAMAPVS